jgi:hypothetical protein
LAVSRINDLPRRNSNANPPAQDIVESSPSAEVSERTLDSVTPATVRRWPKADFREHAERGETLARALSTTIKQEIERLKSEKHNDPEGQAGIDFLEVISTSSIRLPPPYMKRGKPPRRKIEKKNSLKRNPYLEI